MALRVFFLFCLLALTASHSRADGVYKSFEEALYEPHKVESIRITYKGLKELPDIFDRFPNLVELNLSNNQIETLPPSLFKAKKLRILKLYKNNISDLPSEIGQLKNLVHLSLSYNNLELLPDSIGDRH